MQKNEEPDLGPCVIGCGRAATVRKHRVCATCYPSLRTWANAKDPDQRRTYAAQLTVRQARLAAIEQKLVVIGTSPYNWKRASKSNVIRLNLSARQRGAAR